LTSSLPKFVKGDSVLLRTTRELGRVEEPPRLDGGEYWYKVRFSKRPENIVEDDLEPLTSTDESIEALALSGQWGRLQAFRCALAYERIRNQNHSTIYSFRSQRVLFEPHQYKPLLKILNSQDRRLIIADEVGMGKTIEAGIILSELEARRQLSSVLVVCPSRLRIKWLEELNRKFAQNFQVYSKAALSAYLEHLRHTQRRVPLRGIVSMQTMRNHDLRELLAAELGQVDMVIVDEAHHARNPHTQTSEMLRDLCSEIGECVLLLTATPVHLGSRDLFTLLNALRPSEFRDAQVFERLLCRNAAVHIASSLVRTQRKEDLPTVSRLLTECLIDGVARERQNPLAVQVLTELQTQAPSTKRGWVDLERRVQDLHPLSSILTRTRKRDVHENIAVRKANVLRCHFTVEEHALYDAIVGQPHSKGWLREGMSLGQIQRARQAASCLPAAIASKYETARSDDDAVELTDILPSEAGAEIAGSNSLREVNADSTFTDSKLKHLDELLAQVWSEDPSAKILVFTYFVGTAKYLENRLNQQAIPTLRISGDVPSDPHRPQHDERGKRIQLFRDDPDFRVLVSTEVGSEGLDFQFCHHVVNYDLPWNPMVVEQRIGRIDRYGQTSPVVHVHSLVVEGTVEDRILARLYERIGIFRESIGDLETILGETLGTLQKDYISGRLTPADADARVEQAARAIEQRRLELENLQRNAAELFGHEEFIREELHRVSRLGRFVTAESMLALLKTFFESEHPSVRLWPDGDGIFALRMSEELRHQIQRAAGPGGIWFDSSLDGILRITFEGEVAFKNAGVELLNASHPLVIASLQAIGNRFEFAASRVGQASLELDNNTEAELPPGQYYIAVFKQTVTGIRNRKVLESICWGNDHILENESGERMMHLVLQKGVEWDDAHRSPGIPSAVWDQIHSEARRRNRELRASEALENDALFHRRRTALELEAEHTRSIKETRLRTAESRGHIRVIPAFRGQLAKIDAELQAKLAELETSRSVTIQLSEPIAVCAVRVLSSRTGGNHE
jgi:SNF2 family DNA or RNA helicase